MRIVRRLAFVFVLASPLAVTGCKQGVGDRCQVQSDCEDGLLCILPPAGSPQTGGTCSPPGGADAGVDLASTLDLASPEQDFSTSTDGPQPDLTTAD